MKRPGGTRTFRGVRQLASAAALALLSAPAPAAETGRARGMSADDLHALRSVGQVRIAPDGERIVYALVSRKGERRATTELRVWDADSGRSSALLREGGGSGARWSPDGKWVAFVEHGSEGAGLMVVGASPSRTSASRP